MTVDFSSRRSAAVAPGKENQQLGLEAHFFAARPSLDVPRLSELGRIAKNVLEWRV